MTFDDPIQTVHGTMVWHKKLVNEYVVLDFPNATSASTHIAAIDTTSKTFWIYPADENGHGTMTFTVRTKMAEATIPELIYVVVGKLAELGMVDPIAFLSTAVK